MEPPIQTEYLRSGGAVTLTYQKKIQVLLSEPFQVREKKKGKAAKKI